MPQRERGKLLEDVIFHSVLAQRFAATGFEQYVGNQQTRYAGERVLQIVGEALSQALAQDVDLAWRISDLRKVIAFRHLLTHRYFRISSFLVWNIIQNDLPRLIKEVEVLLAAPGVPGESV